MAGTVAQSQLLGTPIKSFSWQLTYITQFGQTWNLYPLLKLSKTSVTPGTAWRSDAQDLPFSFSKLSLWKHPWCVLRVNTLGINSEGHLGTTVSVELFRNHRLSQSPGRGCRKSGLSRSLLWCRPSSNRTSPETSLETHFLNPSTLVSES